MGPDWWSQILYGNSHGVEYRRIVGDDLKLLSCDIEVGAFLGCIIDFGIANPKASMIDTMMVLAKD